MKRDRQIVAKRLKEARGPMTQVEVSKALKLSQAVLSKIESGIREPTAAELGRFARLYNKPTSYFFEEEKPSPTVEEPFKKYGKGCVVDSIQFILREMAEFDQDYANKNCKEYTNDIKLQKLIEKTIENVLTTAIDVSKVELAREGIVTENCSERMRKAGRIFKLDEFECEDLAKLVSQRNYLMHRYLDLKWQVVITYKQSRPLLMKFLRLVLDKEGAKV